MRFALPIPSKCLGLFFLLLVRHLVVQLKYTRENRFTFDPFDTFFSGKPLLSELFFIHIFYYAFKCHV